MIENFKKDVKRGLSSEPKWLSSKYFYDDIGSELFVKITQMPEYYLTDAEMEIFKTQTQSLIDALDVHPSRPFDLIELGAGDGTKTRHLLKALMDQDFNYRYVPIDISKSALENLEKSLKSWIPELEVAPQHGDYFQVISEFKNSNRKKVILFLGSNIGNMKDDQARAFLNEMDTRLNPNDIFLLGVDMIKSHQMIMPAYDDPHGITAAFNMNLLKRMNDELGAHFNLEKFEHRPEYNEETGIVKSFIVSTENQEVYIESLNETFSFKRNEKIQTETSRKYNDKLIEQLIKDNNFSIKEKIMDSQQLFSDYILEKKR